MQQDQRPAPRSDGPRPDETLHLLLSALTVVRGNAQLIERRMRRPASSDPEVISASVGRIIEAADRLTRTVAALLADANQPTTPDASSEPPSPTPESNTPGRPSPPTR